MKNNQPTDYKARVDALVVNPTGVTLFLAPAYAEHLSARFYALVRLPVDCPGRVFLAPGEVFPFTARQSRSVTVWVNATQIRLDYDGSVYCYDRAGELLTARVPALA
jgi:hypothetical protein